MYFVLVQDLAKLKGKRRGAEKEAISLTCAFSVADKKLSASRPSEGGNIRFRGTIINRQRRQIL